MKKLLITGTSSYIGNSLESWLKKSDEKYVVDKISLRGESWKDVDFSNYDSVFHVAGIVHIKETPENRESYYKVNRDLVVEVAQKASQEGVKQFIFLSTMSVYGMESGTIGRSTLADPKNNYGKSKLEAEGLLDSLNREDFRIAVLRPPMVYGKGCKGNYPRLSSFARKAPFFPGIENRRSMIYIDNLSEFIRHLIDDEKSGLFFPQNREYVSTSEMVKRIAELHGKRIVITNIFNPIIRALNVDLAKKMFGDLIYEKRISEYEKNYQLFGFEETIRLTEVGGERSES